VAYVWGIGVPKNTAMALQKFHEAFNQKIGNAAFDLGDMYYFGHGVPIDKAAAEHWFEAGAKLHDAPSEYRLAMMLSESKDRANLHKQVDLLRESANAGYVPAMHALGLLLVRNPELAGSTQEAIHLLEEASKAGTWRSSVVLGILERDGKGMPTDDRAALYHFQLAILQGGDVAERLVKKDVAILSARVGEEQTAAAQSEAGSWYQQHHLALQFIYKDGYNRRQFPAFALTVPEPGEHAGRLVPTPTAVEEQLSLGSSGGRASKEGESDQPLATSYVEE
jgi:Sel1 repeat